MKYLTLKNSIFLSIETCFEQNASHLHIGQEDGNILSDRPL
jgi:hypothetical protein